MRIRWTVKKLALAALLAFAAGLIGLWAMYGYGRISSVTVPIDIDKSFDASTVDSISLNGNSVDIVVKKSDSNELKVRLTGKIPEADAHYADVSADASGNSLNVTIRTVKRYAVGIDVNRLFSWIENGFGPQGVAEVELPDKIYKTLKIRTDIGDAALPPLKAEALTLQTDTGDIKLDGFQGEALDAKTNTGTIRLQHIDSAVNATSDTGDIALALNRVTKNVTAHSDTGDVSITVLQAGPMELDFRSDTGKTTASAANGALSFEVKEKHHLVGKIQGGGIPVKVRTDTGDIAIDVK